MNDNEQLRYVESFKDIYLDNLQLTIYYPDGYKTDDLWTKENIIRRLNDFSYKDYVVEMAENFNSFVLAKGFLCVNRGVTLRKVLQINIDEDKLRIKFHGLFFERDNIMDDIKSVSEVERLFFYNKYDVTKKISRLDLATNIKTFMPNIKFINPYGAKIKKDYHSTNGDKEVLTWAVCGSPKSKESAQLVIYDKREDLNHKKNHSIDRFGTYDYLRAEFRLPSQCLRKHGLDSLTDLYLVSADDWLNIWRVLSSGKTYQYRNGYLPPTARPRYLEKVEVASYWDNVQGQVIGILNKLDWKDFSLAMFKGSENLRDEDNNRFLKLIEWVKDKTIVENPANYKKLGRTFS